MKGSNWIVIDRQQTKEHSALSNVGRHLDPWLQSAPPVVKLDFGQSRLEQSNGRGAQVPSQGSIQQPPLKGAEGSLIYCLSTIGSVTLF